MYSYQRSKLMLFICVCVNETERGMESFSIFHSPVVCRPPYLDANVYYIYICLQKVLELQSFSLIYLLNIHASYSGRKHDMHATIEFIPYAVYTS